MGMDVYTKVVVGAEFGSLHKHKREDTFVTRYDSKTGEPRQVKNYIWSHIFNGKEYSEEEYKAFIDAAEELGLTRFHGNSADDTPDLVGIAINHPNYKCGYTQPIEDFLKVNKLIEEVKALVVQEPLCLPPESVKLWSISVLSV